MLVIFDVDGTLLDSWSWLADQLAAGAARFGYLPLDRADIERLRGLETRDVLAALQVPPDRTAELVLHLRRRAEDETSRLKVFDGIPGLLGELSDRGDRLALVSSNSEGAVRAALGPRVSGMFEFWRCDIGVFDKASAFDELLGASGFEPSSVLAVGDETRDVDAAAQAGIDMIAVEWGYADADLLRAKAPRRTAGTVGQLSAMLTVRRNACEVRDQ